MHIRFSEWLNEVLVAYKSSPGFSDNSIDKGKVKKKKDYSQTKNLII